jgi:serine/threonine protein kinase/predicted ATPase
LRPDALSRYQVRRELGRGGTGVVYEAYDAKDRTVVALKTIDSASSEQLYRLKHEFRALADVQHPNLVRFGELACEHDQWFFTMELVRGSDFIEYVRAPSAEDDSLPALPVSGVVAASTPTVVLSDGVPEVTACTASGAASDAIGLADAAPSSRGTEGSRVREQRLRAALLQLVDALSAIHEAGHVHRDVKPSNVLVAKDGRVVVLDFGLVSVAAGAESSSETLIVGTPAYMAPEQVLGAPVGPAADWYAVGVILYLALTGALPLDGSNAEIMDAKIERTPPPPHWLVPGLPPDLASLALDLLKIDPTLRPRAEEIRARLGATPSLVAHRSNDGAGQAFVGRARELGVLSRALDEVTAERATRRFVVQGEPGMGKSALVRRFLQRRATGACTLVGRCYAQEDVPFKGIDDIVDALSEHLLGLAAHEVETIIAGGVRYLTVVFPVLLRVPAIESASTSTRAIGNPAAIREQAFREFQDLIQALAHKATLILFVDDLQWADRDSIALFRRVLFGKDAAPLLFLATIRTDAELSSEIAAFASEAECIALGGLSPDESRALLDAIWSARGATSASKDDLIQEAEGHPLFLAELVRSAGGKPLARGKKIELQEVLWDRIQGRDPIERDFLAMVAVGGIPLPYEVVAGAAEVDPGEVQTRLGSLRAAQFIRVSRQGERRTVEPYHARVRESIVAHLQRRTGGAYDVAKMHGRLARALLANTANEELESGVFAIVQHFNAARETLTERSDLLEVASLNLLASRQALRATAYDRARSYARAGLALVGEQGWGDAYRLARDLHVECMRAETFADDASEPVEAGRLFDLVRSRAQSESDRTDVCVEWISLLTMRRQLVQAIAVGRERLEELGIGLPLKVTPEVLVLQRERIRRLQGGRGTSELASLPELTSIVHEGAVRTLVALVPAAFFLDAALLAWIHTTVVALSIEHGVCDAASFSFSGYGTQLSRLGDPVEGASYGLLGLALNDRFKNEKLAARILFHYGGWHASWVRPFSEAKAMLLRASELAKTHGDTTHETYAATVLSVVTFCESADLAEVQKTGAWAAQVGARRKDFDMASVAETHERYAAALRTGPALVANLGREGSSDADFRARLGAKTPTALFYYFYCNAELAYLAADFARADALLKEAVNGAHVIFGLPTTVELCLLECLVAAKSHARASNDQREERARREEEVTARIVRLEKWAQRCAVNFEPHYLLAVAATARMGDAVDTAARYEEAVVVARLHQSSKREAFALELAFTDAAASGRMERASVLRAEAVRAYRCWGAVAKANALECGG